MIAPAVRFGLFVALVLILPGALMAAGLTDLGKLAMLLSPGAGGLALGRGLGKGGSRPRWRWVGVAAVVLGTGFVVYRVANPPPPRYLNVDT